MDTDPLDRQLVEAVLSARPRRAPRTRPKPTQSAGKRKRGPASRDWTRSAEPRLKHFRDVSDEVAAAVDPSSYPPATEAWLREFLGEFALRCWISPHRGFTKGESTALFHVCHGLHSKGALSASAEAYALLNDALEARGAVNERTLPDEDAASGQLRFYRVRRAQILAALRRFDEAERELDLVAALLRDSSRQEGDRSSVDHEWHEMVQRWHESDRKALRDARAARLGRSGWEWEVADDEPSPDLRYWLARIEREDRIRLAAEWAGRLSVALVELCAASGLWDAEWREVVSDGAIDRLLPEWDAGLLVREPEMEAGPWLHSFAVDLEAHAIFMADAIGGGGSGNPLLATMAFEESAAGYEFRPDALLEWQGRPVCLIGPAPEAAGGWLRAAPGWLTDLGQLAIAYPPSAMVSLAADARLGTDHFLPYVQPMNVPLLGESILRMGGILRDGKDGPELVDFDSEPT